MDDDFAQILLDLYPFLLYDCFQFDPDLYTTY